MSTIYWIEILDSLRIMFIVCTIICMIVGIVFIGYSMDEGEEKDRKIGLWLLLLKTLFFIAFTFTPSTEKAYKIIGIGGTIDYLRTNDTAKKMPDKCIKALDMFLDKAIERNDSINIKK